MPPHTSFLVLTAVSALLCGLPAQDKTDKPAPQPAADKPGDTNAPPETPEEKVARLEAEVARLRGEISYVQGRQGAIARSIADRLQRQGQAPTIKVFDAGRSAAGGITSTTEMRKAVVAEPGKLPDGVAMSVNGRFIMQNVIDDLINYLGTYPASGNEETRRTRATMELIRIEAMNAEYERSAGDAFGKARMLQTEIEAGESFEELAKKNSVGPGAAQGGDPGPITRNSHLGLIVEQLAFSTEPGKVTPIFRNHLGFCLMKVLKVDKGLKSERGGKTEPGEERPVKGQKGEKTEKTGEQAEAVAQGELNPDFDRATVRLIVIPWHEDFHASNQPLTWTSLGQAEILIRDEEVRKLRPAQFR